MCVRACVFRVCVWGGGVVLLALVTRQPCGLPARPCAGARTAGESDCRDMDCFRDHL